MDKYKISGHDLRGFYDTEEELVTVFRDIEKDLNQENKVVCRFIVNEMELDEGDEVQAGFLKLKDIQTLEFWTDSLNNLVPDILDSWKEALPELIKACDELGNSLRFENYKSSAKTVRSLIENCEYLVHSLISLQQYFGEEAVNQFVPWIQNQEDMQRLVIECTQALEKKDYVLLADVLEFDMAHNLGQWMQFIDFAKTLVESQELSQFEHASSSLLGRSQKVN